jgi:molybdopterin-guanine dinucleotide biosynthesis protein B
MPPVVAIAGYSRSGKTSLMERLIGELRERGYRVAAVKHTGKDFEVDHPRKDSWRFGEAGSDAVVVSGPRRLALVRRQTSEASFEEILGLIGDDFDIVLVEGFHRTRMPRIEVHRSDLGRELRSAPEELHAVVTDEPLPVTCPQFAPEETGRLADFISERFLHRQEDELEHEAGAECKLWVNGSAVPIGPFTQRIIINTLTGLVSTLKGVERVKSLRLSMRIDAPIGDPSADDPATDKPSTDDPPS